MRMKSRPVRMQFMASPEMRDKIIKESQKFGLSVSSYLELIVGAALAPSAENMTLINEKVV